MWKPATLFLTKNFEHFSHIRISLALCPFVAFNVVRFICVFNLLLLVNAT